MMNMQDGIEGDIDDEIAELRFQALLTKTENEAEVSSAYEPLSNKNNGTQISLNQPLSQFHGSNHQFHQSHQYRGHQRGRQNYKPYLETFSQQIASNSVNSSNIVVLTTTGSAEASGQFSNETYNLRGRGRGQGNWQHGTERWQHGSERWQHGNVRGPRGNGRRQRGNGRLQYGASGLIPTPSNLSQKSAPQLILPQDKYAATSKPQADSSDGSKAKLSARMRRLQGSGSDSEDSESDSSDESSSNSSTSDSSSSSSDSSSTGSDTESESDTINQSSKKLEKKKDVESSINPEKELDRSNRAVNTSTSMTTVGDNKKLANSNTKPVHVPMKTNHITKSVNYHTKNDNASSPTRKSPNFVDRQSRSPYKYRSTSPRYKKLPVSPYSPRRLRSPIRSSPSHSPNRYSRRRSISPRPSLSPKKINSKLPVCRSHSPNRRYSPKSSPLLRTQDASPISKKSMSPFSRQESASKRPIRSPRYRSRSPRLSKWRKSRSRSPINPRYRSTSPGLYKHLGSKSPNRRRFSSKSPEKRMPLRKRNSLSLTPERYRHSPFGSRSPDRRRKLQQSPRRFDRMNSPSRKLSPQRNRRLGSESPTRQTNLRILSPFSRDHPRSPDTRNKYRSIYSRSPNRSPRSKSPYTKHIERSLHGPSPIGNVPVFESKNKLDASMPMEQRDKGLFTNRPIRSRPLSPRLNQQNSDRQSHPLSPHIASYPAKFGSKFQENSPGVNFCNDNQLRNVPRPSLFGPRPSLFGPRPNLPNFNYPPPMCMVNMQQPPPRPNFGNLPRHVQPLLPFRGDDQFDKNSGRNVHGRLSRGGMRGRLLRGGMPYRREEYPLEHGSNMPPFRDLLPPYISNYNQPLLAIMHNKKLQGPKTPPYSPKRDPSPTEWQKSLKRRDESEFRKDMHDKLPAFQSDYLVSHSKNPENDQKQDFQKKHYDLNRKNIRDCKSPAREHTRDADAKSQNNENFSSPFKSNNGAIRSQYIERQGIQKSPSTKYERVSRSPQKDRHINIQFRNQLRDGRSPLEDRERYARSSSKQKQKEIKSPYNKPLQTDAISPYRDFKSPNGDYESSHHKDNLRKKISPLRDHCQKDRISPLTDVDHQRNLKSSIGDHQRSINPPAIRDRQRDVKSPHTDHKRDVKSPHRDHQRDAKSPHRDHQRDVKSPNRDHQRHAKSPHKDHQIDAKSSHRDHQIDAKSSHRDHQIDAKSSHRDHQIDAKSSHRDHQIDAKSSHRDHQRDAKSPHRDHQKDAKSPHRVRQKDVKSPHRDHQRDAKSPHRDHQRDAKSPHRDRQRDAKSPNRDRQRETKSPHSDRQRERKFAHRDNQKNERSLFRDREREESKRGELTASHLPNKLRDRSINNYRHSSDKSSDQLNTKIKDENSQDGRDFRSNRNQETRQSSRDKQSDKYVKKYSRDHDKSSREDSKRLHQHSERAHKGGHRSPEKSCKDAKYQTQPSAKSQQLTNDEIRLSNKEESKDIQNLNPNLKNKNIDRREKLLPKEEDSHKVEGYNDPLRGVISTAIEEKSSNAEENKNIPSSDDLVNESEMQNISKSTSLDTTLEENPDEEKSVRKQKHKSGKAKKSKDNDDSKKKKKKYKNVVDEKKAHKKMKKRELKKKRKHSDKHSSVDPEKQISIKYEKSGDRTVSIRGNNSDLRGSILGKRDKRDRSHSKIVDERPSKISRSFDNSHLDMTDPIFNQHINFPLSVSSDFNEVDNDPPFDIPINYGRREEDNSQYIQGEHNHGRESRHQYDSSSNKGRNFVHVTVDDKDRKVTTNFNKKKKRKSDGSRNVLNRGAKSGGHNFEPRPMSVHERLGDNRTDLKRRGGGLGRKREDSYRCGGGGGRNGNGNDGRRRKFTGSNR